MSVIGISQTLLLMIVLTFHSAFVFSDCSLGLYVFLNLGPSSDNGGRQSNSQVYMYICSRLPELGHS